MVAIITDCWLKKRLIRHRRARGIDRYDEVWDGVYFINAPPNIEHQGLVSRLTHILQFVIDDANKGTVYPGCNISDRNTRWRENYRVPDVAVFLQGNTAVNKNTYWLGGPDLAIEIVSPRDRSREKLDFYAAVGTRELLVIDRYPWSLELYVTGGATMRLAGSSSPDKPEWLDTNTVSLRWRMQAGAERPVIEAMRPDSLQQWLV